MAVLPVTWWAELPTALVLLAMVVVMRRRWR